MTLMRINRSVIYVGVSLLLSGSLPARAAENNQVSISSKDAAVLRSGEESRLREALKHGFPINGRDAQGNTPLILAAAYGDVSFVRLLVEHGADVNATNLAGATPLMRAAADYEKARLL